MAVLSSEGHSANTGADGGSSGRRRAVALGLMSMGLVAVVLLSSYTPATAEPPAAVADASPRSDPPSLTPRVSAAPPQAPQSMPTPERSANPAAELSAAMPPPPPAEKAPPVHDAHASEPAVPSGGDTYAKPPDHEWTSPPSVVLTLRPSRQRREWNSSESVPPAPAPRDSGYDSKPRRRRWTASECDADLEGCIGPVEGRAPDLANWSADPGLACTAYNRQYYASAFALYGGFRAAQPKYDRLLEQQTGVPVARVFGDYGCFTASRGPTNTVVGNVGGKWVGAARRNRTAMSLVDMASVWLTGNYHTNELAPDGGAYADAAVQMLRRAEQVLPAVPAVPIASATAAVGTATRRWLLERGRPGAATPVARARRENPDDDDKPRPPAAEALASRARKDKSGLPPLGDEAPTDRQPPTPQRDPSVSRANDRSHPADGDGSAGGWGMLGRHLASSQPQPELLAPIAGDVAVLPARYQEFLFGQQFQEFVTGLARFYTSGVLAKKAGVTLVAFRSSDPKDHQLRAWVGPLISDRNGTRSGVREIVWLPRNAAVLTERPWFVAWPGMEMTAPCTSEFLTRFLLPRALAAARADPAFDYADVEACASTAGNAINTGGNGARRCGGAASALRLNARQVSDTAWAAQTFPRKIVIVKQDRHARHKRAFQVPQAGRDMLRRLGFEWVDDAAPFAHRLALISHAEVLVTTFGALHAITSHLYGGADRRANPLRVIVLMHPQYAAEQAWWAPGPCRVGTQGGLRVVVTDTAALQAPNAWTKLVVASSGILGPESFPDAVFHFSAEDCTADATVATDMPSTRHPRDPKTDPKRHSRRASKTWGQIPGFGHTCPPEV